MEWWISLGGLLISAVTLFVLWRTLVWIRQYARDTEAIKKAAQEQSRQASEQSEAAWKPCIVVDVEPRDFHDAVWDSSVWDSPHAMRLKPGYITLVNIGRGPAMGLRFLFEERRDATAAWRERDKTKISHLSEGQRFPSHVTAEACPGDLILTAHYESLSGRGYRTRAIFHDRVLKGFVYPELKARSSRIRQRRREILDGSLSEFSPIPSSVGRSQGSSRPDVCAMCVCGTAKGGKKASARRDTPSGRCLRNS